MQPLSGGDWILEVKVTPKAKRDAILGVQQNVLRVSVREAPEKGKANAAATRLLAEALGVSKHDVVLIQGDVRRNKRFLMSARARPNYERLLLHLVERGRILY